VVAWQHTARPAGPAVRILPDGCLDLIWHDGDLFIAGPDTFAQVSTAGGSFVGLRFAAGPGFLRVPADALRDRHTPLAALWHPADVRRLSEQVAEQGVVALERAVATRWRAPDPLMVAVAAQARRAHRSARSPPRAG
jgi:hypothetical protein